MSLLSFQTLGSTDHTPLMFLHGLGAGSQQTTSALHGLPHTYLIAPDMPGHGETQPKETASFSFDAFADLTINLMDHLGLKKINLGGLSMGSGIALNIALRYPERIANLILLRPSWLNHKHPEHLKLVAWVGQWIEQLGVSAAKDKLLSDSDFLILKNQNPPVADSIVGLFERPTTPASTAVLYKMWQDAPFSTLDDLTKVTNNTLILTSPRDELHPSTTAESIAQFLPNASIRALPPRYHQNEAYTQALRHEVSRFLTPSSGHLES